MNIWPLNALTKALGRLWRRVQIWRGKRLYERVRLLQAKQKALYDKANRLIGDNSRPPPPTLL
jgi:hypothetical protein